MRGKMLRLVMLLNIVLSAYSDGFIADKVMWYVVDLSEKIFQSPLVVEHTLLLVHLALFCIHGVESTKKRKKCQTKLKLRSSMQMCHLIVTWTSKTTQQHTRSGKL